MIWSREETLPRAEIEEIQLARLKETVQQNWDKVPAYRKKMEEAGIRPEHIQSLKDLSKLPFVTKQDLRDNYPFGMFAVPKEKLVRVHASSGTTGKPVPRKYFLSAHKPMTSVPPHLRYRTEKPPGKSRRT